MQGMRFSVGLHFHGTLGANATGQFVVPCACTLDSVSFCASNAASSTLEVGTSADRDGLLDAVAVGQSNVPVLYGESSFDGALITPGDSYFMEAGTIFCWDLDYDGASGTAGQNVSVVFNFMEG